MAMLSFGRDSEIRSTPQVLRDLVRDGKLI